MKMTRKQRGQARMHWHNYWQNLMAAEERKQRGK